MTVLGGVYNSLWQQPSSVGAASYLCSQNIFARQTVVWLPEREVESYVVVQLRAGSECMLAGTSLAAQGSTHVLVFVLKGEQLFSACCVLSV